jgi:alanine dehydrogenase
MSRLHRAMVDSGAVCLAYETVERVDGSLPLLIPMSEVAGRMSIQEGAKYLEKPLKGRGILLGGVPGVRPAKVLVLVEVLLERTLRKLLPVWERMLLSWM